MTQRVAAVLLSLLLCACEGMQNDASTVASDGLIDYWVLALSWSAEHCASDQAKPDSRQCAVPRGFIVHGLWPQYSAAKPAHCDFERRIDSDIADELSDLMPDRGLVFHQWRKHGGCTGMSAEAYFALIRRAARSVRIPTAAIERAKQSRVSERELESDFIDANPRLSAASIVFTCRREFLREVRICLNPDLSARDCGSDVRNSCGSMIKARRGA